MKNALKERKTAFITGASSGIGEVFARRLAEDGYNLVLTARRGELLQKLAAELQARYLIKTEIILADLSKLSDIQRLEKHISNMKNLEMLINNAGFGTKTGNFDQSDIDKQTDMITVHITAPVRLCRAALPVMTANKKGFIINVSSMASFTPIPKGINYGATKTYLNFFSEGLQRELDGKNIKVQALCPGFTYTGFHDTEEFEPNHRDHIPKTMWSSAESVVEESLRALKKNKVIVVPGFKNRLFVGLRPIIQPLIVRLRRK